jgi:hypothetical protein
LLPVRNDKLAEAHQPENKKIKYAHEAIAIPF